MARKENVRNILIGLLGTLFLGYLAFIGIKPFLQIPSGATFRIYNIFLGLLPVGFWILSPLIGASYLSRGYKSNISKFFYSLGAITGIYGFLLAFNSIENIISQSTVFMSLFSPIDALFFLPLFFLISGYITERRNIADCYRYGSFILVFYVSFLYLRNAVFSVTFNGFWPPYLALFATLIVSILLVGRLGYKKMFRTAKRGSIYLFLIFVILPLVLLAIFGGGGGSGDMGHALGSIFLTGLNFLAVVTLVFWSLIRTKWPLEQDR